MATLKVKIQEDVILENQDYGSKRTLEISSINEIYKRLVTCPASQSTTVAVFAGNVNDAAGAIDVQDSKYMRITNLDSSNAIEIAIVGAATLYQVKLSAGQSHILGSADALMLSDPPKEYKSIDSFAFLISSTFNLPVDLRALAKA